MGVDKNNVAVIVKRDGYFFPLGGAGLSGGRRLGLEPLLQRHVHDVLVGGGVETSAVTDLVPRCRTEVRVISAVTLSHFAVVGVGPRAMWMSLPSSLRRPESWSLVGAFDCGLPLMPQVVSIGWCTAMAAGS